MQHLYLSHQLFQEVLESDRQNSNDHATLHFIIELKKEQPLRMQMVCPITIRNIMDIIYLGGSIMKLLSIYVNRGQKL